MKQFKNYQGREVVFIASYGSTNYGTRTPESDNDYKVYLMPTFDDLYNGTYFKSNPKIDGDDYEFKDVRQLAKLFYKANPAYLEILEAKEVWINPKYQNFYGWLKKNKYRIAKMNLKAHYSALTGMAMQKLKAIEKDLPNSDNNEGYKRRQKFGFDTKQLMHIMRLMSMREDIFSKGVNPLSVVNLEKEPSKHGSCDIRLRDDLLAIKSNESGMSKEQAIKLGKIMIDDSDTIHYSEQEGNLVERSMAEYVKSLPIDEEMNQMLIDKIRELVKKGFK